MRYFYFWILNTPIQLHFQMSFHTHRTNYNSHRDFKKFIRRIEKITNCHNEYCVTSYYVNIPDLLKKYSKKPHITEGIQIIKELNNQMQLTNKQILFRSCYLFNELIKKSKIMPRSSFQKALACLFYALVKNNYKITMIEFLKLYYDGDLNKKLILRFIKTQNDVISELRLEKIFEQSCNYFRYLSDIFETYQLSEQNFRKLYEYISKSGVCQFIMKRAFFASIFYHMCRQNKINISQKNICDSLYVSRKTLGICCKELYQFLKNNPIDNHIVRYKLKISNSILNT